MAQLIDAIRADNGHLVCDPKLKREAVIMSFLIACPICGKRDAYEFRFGGEDGGPRPEETDLTSDRWLDYVHLRASGSAPRKEWWCHRSGCGLWFTIWRNPMTNLEVKKTETNP